MKFRKLFHLVLFIFHFINGLQAQRTQQTKLDLIQGSWEYNGNSLGPEKGFLINKNRSSLSFTFWNDSLDFPLSESIVGFQDHDPSGGDSISANSLKDDGLYYTLIDKGRTNRFGWVHRPYYTTPEYFEIRDDFMAINGGKLYEFNRVHRLPPIALKMLYNRGKKDKRNYIKEYLGAEVQEIKSDSPVYSEPRVKTQVLLPKGELVYLKEVKGAWQKIEYERNENLLQGWIERKYLK